MKFVKIFVIFAFFLFSMIFSSCDLITNLFHTPQKLEITIITDKSTYEYAEPIHVKLDILSEPNRDVSIVWKINGAAPEFSILDPKDFTFSLTPAMSTEYTLSATVTDGYDTITKDFKFTVEPLAKIGS